MNTMRQTLVILVLLISFMISGCGSKQATKQVIKGSVKDVCTDTGDLAKGATISLAPQEQDGFGIEYVDGEWQGKTAAVKIGNSGTFEFKKVSDGNYGIFLMGATAGDEQGNAVLIEMKDGKSQNVGVVQITKGSDGGCTLVSTFRG